jgi:hypothetical protein
MPHIGSTRSQTSDSSGQCQDNSRNGRSLLFCKVCPILGYLSPVQDTVPFLQPTSHPVVGRPFTGSRPGISEDLFGVSAKATDTLTLKPREKPLLQKESRVSAHCSCSPRRLIGVFTTPESVIG